MANEYFTRCKIVSASSEDELEDLVNAFVNDDYIKVISSNLHVDYYEDSGGNRVYSFLCLIIYEEEL